MSTAVRFGSFRKAAAAVGLAVCLMAGTAAAQTPNTDWYNKSETNFAISSADQLAGLADIVNGKAGGIEKDNFSGKTITLTKDIDLAGYSNWVPIGDGTASSFNGTFDGGEYVISNLTINRPGADYQGLFGFTGSTVKNLGLENVNILGRDKVGGITGYLVNILISNDAVVNCYTTGVVSGRDNVGGLVGEFGGIIAAVANSYSACTVSGVDYIGGLVGQIAAAEIINSYSIGVVIGTNYVGGVAGLVWSDAANIKNCAALNPEVKGKSGNVGRVVGSTEFPGGVGKAAISGLTAFVGMKNNAGDTEWANKSADNLDGANISGGAIYLDNTIKGLFKTADGWTPSNGMLPGLHGKAVAMPEHLKPDDYLWYVNNLSSKTFSISTAGELAALAHIVNGTWGGTPAKDSFSGKTVTLTKDIDLAGYSNWVPIGRTGGRFEGTFDGGKHVISNLTINCPAVAVQGLFGEVRGGHLKNLGLEKVNIKGDHSVGGLVGMIYGGSTVINCYTTGAVIGSDLVGGLVGDSWADGVSVGGLIRDSYSSCAVSGVERVGGVVGKIRAHALRNCYSIGVVSGIEMVGGVAGIFDALGSGDETVQNCAALNPEVKGTGDNVGRVVGKNVGGDIKNLTAFAGMKNNAGNTEWANKGADKLDGDDITIADIKADGAIGGFFSTDNGWTVANGKLPGLFGKSVELPEYLGGVTSVRSPRQPHSASAQFVRVSGGTLQLRFADRGKVEIYSLKGAKVRAFDLGVGAHTLRLNDLPRGAYVVRAAGGAWKQSVRMVLR